MPWQGGRIRKRVTAWTEMTLAHLIVNVQDDLVLILTYEKHTEVG